MTAVPARSHMTPELRRTLGYYELRDLIDDLGGHLPPSAELVTDADLDRITHDTTLILGAAWRLHDALAQVAACRQRMLAESSGDAPDIGEVRYG